MKVVMETFISSTFLLYRPARQFTESITLFFRALLLINNGIKARKEKINETTAAHMEVNEFYGNLNDPNRYTTKMQFLWFLREMNSTNAQLLHHSGVTDLEKKQKKIIFLGFLKNIKLVPIRKQQREPHFFNFFYFFFFLFILTQFLLFLFFFFYYLTGCTFFFVLYWR